MPTRRSLCFATAALAAAPAPGPARAATPWIDCHTHTFIPGLPRAANARYAPEYDASYDTLLARAEANGVGRVVITQPSFLGFDNSYLLAALKARPERLRGVPWVAPTTTADEFEAMAQLGVVGLRFPIFGLPTPDWREYRTAFAEAARRGWSLDLYVEGRRLPEILPVFLETGAPVAIPHLGMFDRNLGPLRDPGFPTLLDTAKTGRVFMKFSGGYRIGLDGAREAAALLLAAYGPERIVWGSDWPHTNTTEDRVTTYPKTLAWLAEWVPDAVAREAILTTTPARLYRFGGSTG